ncbi:BatD family protein [Fibrobacter sp.]|uniref:BatD family protein n=1 Tax=Fibrobacter sp. TaxID=35828 RepID=UPI0025BC1A7B|nr:BatD family protein [Fibrobacter sp.]MBR3070661.1 hypothetical protein [Fibrobacter sp.]
MNKKENSKTAKSTKSKKVKAAKATPVKESSSDSALVVPAKDSSVLAVESNGSGNVASGVDTSAIENVNGIDADSTADDDNVTAPPLPTPEQLGISISAGNPGGTLTATVGDTLVFPVTVSWSINGSAILVVPMSTANAKGILQVGMSQESSRSVKNGKEMAQITFNYKLVVQDTGNLNIPAMRFEIPTPTGQSLDLRSDSVPLRAEAPVSMLPIVVGVVVALCLLAAGVWRVRRRAAAQATAAKRSAAENALREKMMVLKQRVMVADSREWLLELEGVCKEYAVHKFPELAEGTTAESAGASGMSSAKKSAASAVNLDALVADGKLDGWKPLLEEFAHARYGGGKRDSFENKETWKLAMTLMGVKEED